MRKNYHKRASNLQEDNQWINQKLAQRCLELESQLETATTQYIKHQSVYYQMVANQIFQGGNQIKMNMSEKWIEVQSHH